MLIKYIQARHLIKFNYYKNIIVISIVVCFFTIKPACAKNALYPTDQNLYDQYPWSLMLYYGVTVDNPLLQVLTLHDLKRWPEHIESLELAYTLNENNIIRRIFSPIVGVVQIAGNATMRNDRNNKTIYEFDPYFMFRWANLPWNHIVTTSFAIGEGISYDSSVPSIEQQQNEHTKHLLNYLMFEATFSPPSNPRIQIVARIHHRSGAYGLYRAGNTGSNDIGLGIRYLFD